MAGKKIILDGNNYVCRLQIIKQIILRLIYSSDNECSFRGVPKYVRNIKALKIDRILGSIHPTISGCFRLYGLSHCHACRTRADNM